MSNKEKNLPIMWYEGMPLSPIVFQQAFLYQEKNILNILGSLTNYAWGIINLKWNDLQIKDGFLSLQNIECIFPDFTYCYFPIQDGDVLSINLQDHKNAIKKEELFVFLIIPKNNLACESSFSKARYQVIKSDLIKDFNSLDSEAEISLLKPELKLIIGQEIPSGYSGVPLCKISFNGIEFLIQDYQPPFLHIKNFKEVYEKGWKIISMGKDKLLYLKNKSEEKDIYLINCISRIVFSLEKDVLMNAHPFEFYKTIVNLIGDAYVIKNILNLPLIKPYDHANQKDSILPVLDFIHDAVNEIEEKYSQTVFAEKDEVFFVLNEKFEGFIYVGLFYEENAHYDKINEWISSAVIATEDKLQDVQDQRIIGADRVLIDEVVELNLKSNFNLKLLQITVDHNYISMNKNLYIINSETNKPFKIILFRES